MERENTYSARSRWRHLLAAVSVLALAAAVALPACTSSEPTPEPPPALSSQQPHPFPIVYGGRAFIDGQPTLDGTRIVGRVDGFETHPVFVENGQYRNLVIQPPDRSYFDKTITFHAGEARARETGLFREMSSPDVQSLDLHFGKSP